MQHDQSPEPAEHRASRPAPDAEYRGILTDAIVQTVHEVKPIIEGVGSAYLYDKLTGGSPPPPADRPAPPPSQGPASE